MIMNIWKKQIESVLSKNQEYTNTKQEIQFLAKYGESFSEKKGNKYITKYENEKDINIKVGAISEIRPYCKEQNYYYGGYLVVNIDKFKDVQFSLSNIMIQSENPDKLEESIEKIDQNIIIRNMAKKVKEEKAMILVTKIFLYGFIAVITLIGVTNIFNTITSNMELRQKEFAMLKSIGMTKKEFNRMINLETIFYGSKSLLYGIILGMIGTYFLYLAFSIKNNTFLFPVAAIAISAIAVFILIFVIMKYSVGKINKQNTIDTIRKENIQNNFIINMSNGQYISPIFLCGIY